MENPAQFGGGYPPVGAVIKMLDPGGDVLRKRSLYQRQFHRAGEAEQREPFRPASRHFADGGGHEERVGLDETSSPHRAVASLGQAAFDSGQIVPEDEPLN